MKNILIADNRPDLLATLEPILKHWGYRVLSARTVDQALSFLHESAPDLLIIGRDLLVDSNLALDQDIQQKVKSGELPVIALKQNNEGKPGFTPSETLDVPVGLFELFSFIQRNVENHPRKNLRLRLKLPGMYSIEEDEFILADVLNLSMQGLFFKAQTRVKKGDRVTVVFPLLGHCKEIEVKSTVLYTILPEATNNFFQGFGVGFDELLDNQKSHLQYYIREHFLKEVTSSHNGVGDFSSEQLKA